jgi:hypothetical protein
LAATGRGNRDFDGLSNCAKKKILGTSHRDPDSDADGIDDDNDDVLDDEDDDEDDD